MGVKNGCAEAVGTEGAGAAAADAAADEAEGAELKLKRDLECTTNVGLTAALVLVVPGASAAALVVDALEGEEQDEEEGEEAAELCSELSAELVMRDDSCCCCCAEACGLLAMRVDRVTFTGLTGFSGL